MRLLALFPPRMNPHGIAQYVAAELGERWEVVGAGAADDDLEALETADAMLVALVDVPAAAIDKATKLQLVQTPSHGVDHVDVDAAAARGIPVCNVGTSGAEAATVAEHALMLILACARRVIEGHDGLRSGDWPSLAGSTIELQGKTLGIIGFGHIGREVAKRARSFGMTLLYHDMIRTAEDVEQELRLKRVDLDELLRSSDVVTVHVPLTTATRSLIDDEAIAKMKPGAILVNTSRGAVVDNDAVARAADAGRIIAGIDVYEPEPPPLDHALRKASNVILSPHIAGTTKESVLRIMAAALENLRRFDRGEHIRDVVNGVVG